MWGEGEGGDLLPGKACWSANKVGMYPRSENSGSCLEGYYVGSVGRCVIKEKGRRKEGREKLME